MTRALRIFLLVSVSALVVACATPKVPPQTSTTFELRHAIHADFQHAWEAAVAAVDRRGRIVVSQPDSGVLTFVLRGSTGKQYYNFLLRPGASPGTTLLYVQAFDALSEKIPDLDPKLIEDLTRQAERAEGVPP